jgi:hypothetical protein
VSRGQTLALQVPNQVRVIRAATLSRQPLRRPATRIATVKASASQAPRTVLAGGPRGLR